MQAATPPARREPAPDAQAPAKPTDGPGTSGVDGKAVAAFLALAYALSWALAGAYFTLGFALGDALPFLVMATAYMYGPAAAAVAVQRGWRGRPLAEIGLRWAWNRWWVAAALGPLALVAATVALSGLAPGASLTFGLDGIAGTLREALPPEQAAQAMAELEALGPWLLLAINAGQALVAGLTVNAVVAFGEELGWRGFLQKELAPWGFWRASGAVGVAWGLWHAPLILAGYNYPEHPAAGVGLMTLMTVGLAPLFAYASQRARTVLAAAVAHGTFNAAAGAPLFYVVGGSALATGVTGAAGLAALALANVLLLLWRRRERRRFRHAGGAAPAS